MKKLIAVSCTMLLASFAVAQSDSNGSAARLPRTAKIVNGQVIRIIPPRPDAVQNDREAMGELNDGSTGDGDGYGFQGFQRADDVEFGFRDAGVNARAARSKNPTYHGGPVMHSQKVVPIFWGTYWGSGTGATESATMISFYEQYGTNAEFNVITQYYDTIGGGTNYVALNTLTNAGDAWYDNTNPSAAKVTDKMVQAEVTKYLGSQTFNTSAIYEVFIGSGYYSDDGTGAESCGGKNLQYCAYHSSYTNGGRDIKYSIEPYPNCSGCQASGFSTVQNMQHFACHETREAVTDPDGTGWWSSSTGYELDDECAWSPAPFISGGFGYQYEWSNASSGCVKTR
jgi:hypothetical protein